jgi:hypothetical protein
MDDREDESRLVVSPADRTSIKRRNICSHNRVVVVSFHVRRPMTACHHASCSPLPVRPLLLPIFLLLLYNSVSLRENLFFLFLLVCVPFCPSIGNVPFFFCSFSFALRRPDQMPNQPTLTPFFSFIHDMITTDPTHTTDTRDRILPSLPLTLNRDGQMVAPSNQLMDGPDPADKVRSLVSRCQRFGFFASSSSLP